MAEVEVAVVGACFVDLISYVCHFPKPGETLKSDGFLRGFGGKGANQAVALAKLGSKVSMIGAVGDDPDGNSYVAQLEALGVRCGIAKLSDSYTGNAPIQVLTDGSGENSIVINPGATALVTPEMVDSQWALVAPAKYVLCQSEIPLASTVHVLRRAHAEGKTTVWNPAPCPPSGALDYAAVLPTVSICTPNQGEGVAMAGLTESATPEEVCAALIRLGCGAVVVTLGAHGCCVMAGAGAEAVRVPPTKVEHVVDTTGAGDCFSGSLVFFLSRGLPLAEAARRAGAVAAVSVTRKGTQSSYPVAADLPPELLA